MVTKITRHLVLDNEAVVALLDGTQANPKRAEVVVAIAAANGRRVVPTAVRGEAGWNRHAPAAVNANRLVARDDPLDSSGANRITDLRAAVPAASVVDAAVAVAAERVGTAGGTVEILTSDTADLIALAGHLDARVDVVRL